eukprot:1143766-Pelagomonas_calceolata.AAC.3
MQAWQCVVDGPRVADGAQCCRLERMPQDEEWMQSAPTGIGDLAGKKKGACRGLLGIHAENWDCKAPVHKEQKQATFCSQA